MVPARARKIYFAVEIRRRVGTVVAQAEEQVPPLRRRWRSGSGRNDKTVEGVGNSPSYSPATTNPPAGSGRARESQ